MPMNKVLLYFIVGILCTLLLVNYFVLRKRGEEIADKSILINSLSRQIGIFKLDYESYSNLYFSYEDSGSLENIVLISEAGKKIPFKVLNDSLKNAIVFHFSKLKKQLLMTLYYERE
jgi:hypothetical protein